MSSFTRRHFLASATAAALTSRAVAQSPVHDPLRPQYHLLPPHAWMNDPNGPIFWRGKYHLFFQINPRGGADWGDISWAHAISPDMVHWRLLANVMEPAGTGSPVAAAPDAPDSYGVFSGSAIADGDRALFFYTAVSKSSPDLRTIADPGTSLREQQTVAIATGDLTHFQRQARPLIPLPPAELQPIAGFRDPTVWRDGSTWWMALGSGTRDKQGMVLLYRATVPTGDHADWTYHGPLFTSPGNGRNTPDTVDAGTMLECPDFFELGGHHVLLYSTERKVYWTTGKIDRSTMRFTPSQRGLLDAGAYYAPKSFAGPKGERILWGWIPERRPKEAYIAAGWSGAMSLPRILGVDPDGNLTMRVAPQVDTLIGAPRSLSRPVMIPGLQAKAVLTLDDGGRLDLTMSGKPVLALSRFGPQLHVGEAILELTTPDSPIEIYIDASVIEVFAGNRAACTFRVYPALESHENSLLAVLRGGHGTLADMRPAPVTS